MPPEQSPMCALAAGTLIAVRPWKPPPPLSRPLLWTPLTASVDTAAFYGMHIAGMVDHKGKPILQRTKIPTKPASSRTTRHRTDNKRVVGDCKTLTTVVGDKLASVLLTSQGKARIEAPVQQSILRHIHHCECWSAVQACLAWVGSPAYPVS